MALDVPVAERALELAGQLAPEVGALKIGLELVHVAGLDLLRRLVATGAQVFYDAKLHDIPNTVAGAVRAIGPTGVWMLNLHASGGLPMMQAAVAALDDWEQRPWLLAVTVLTSLDDGELRELWGIPVETAAAVERMAVRAQEAGLDGVVCSPHEAARIRAACGDEFVIVTPGVRPAAAARGDQKRVATPAEAVANGADYLVIGRPITGAADPVAAVRAIAAELA